MKELFKSQYVDVQQILENSYLMNDEYLEGLKNSILRSVHFSGYIVTEKGEVYEGRMGGINGSGSLNYKVVINTEDEEGNKNRVDIPLGKIKLIVVVR